MNLRFEPITGALGAEVSGIDLRLPITDELFTTHILGLHSNESEFLLSFLFEHIRAPEYCCRFRWSANALVIWDNRSTQHKPVNDYFPAHRRMERITIEGDHPY